ncbi:MAG: response regulator [Deltaproteobacteria bacterium]|nr:response regulator [Deltaproteobacteria bacterium]
MKSGFTLFARIMIAFLVLAMLPVTISSMLVVSTYEELLTELAGRIGDMAPGAFDASYATVREATILVSLIMLITVIVTIFGSLYLSRSISLPIRRLLHAFGQVARGDMEIRVPVRGNDEFTELGRGFNAMVRRLATYAREYEEYSVSLERHAAERTAELNLAYERLRRSTEQIEQANRLKSEFVANMSHELRTPLTAIQGYTDLALDGIYGPLPDKLVTALEKIQANSRNLLRLINDVLDLSKIEAGRQDVYPDQFDVRELVEGAADDLRPLFDKKGLSLVVRMDGPVPSIHQDAGKLRQILINLLSNAMKFTERGGVTVTVREERDDHELRIEVADTGIGIEATQTHLVFEQFRQLDGGINRAHGGTGLGLALVRQLAELMGGEVGVVSEAGKGSTFWVQLPVRYDPAHALRLLRTRSRPTVLAIDDDARSLSEIASFLDPAGFAVARCADAESGVDRARDTQPAAVLVDEVMPGMDGWAFLKSMRADPMTAHIPVIMMGYGHGAKAALESGADDYWTRPIPRADRIVRLREIIERARERSGGGSGDGDEQRDSVD